MTSYSEIKRSVPIHTVLNRYGFRAPARAHYRIACMLHGGDGPNFSVSEKDNVFHCFTCGAAGSVIDLVAALEKIDVKQAAIKIASEFHLSPVQASVGLARTTSSLVERYKKMKESSEVILPLNTDLEEGYRGLSKKTIDFWGLRKTANGVLIPLVNSKGKFCSYSIRHNEGATNYLKYENAPGVSKCMPFGLYQNMQDIITKGFAYVVEAQLDCITLWQHGYRNVISIMGSHLNDQQAMLILSVTSSLTLIMDGDLAGRKAASEIEGKWGSIFKISRIDLEMGLDPDEYVIKGGKL